tara:strand:+ start:79417 stop:80550 length:1134 start_codon:yes stop_codon:yes gene_type:complete
MLNKKIVIIGGYGNFGSRISQSLSHSPNVHLIISGRDKVRANKFCNELQAYQPQVICSSVELDWTRTDFSAKLKEISPDIVIHTGGPFQGQDYTVPKACIEANSHYIDLADDRRYVCDVTSLDAMAKSKHLSIISGASSVPGLSSSVVGAFHNHFSQIQSINIAIAPGNKAQRGLATLQGILSYTGHPYKAYQKGIWQDVYGWMDSTKCAFGEPVGERLLANINVPDLELFVEHYPNIQSVQFQAGLELPVLHYIMVTMAYIAKKKIVQNWAPMAKIIFNISNLFDMFGSNIGGMRVAISGLDLNGKDKTIHWTLYAEDGIGPYIPTFSTCILAKKIIDNKEVPIGAMPCFNLYHLEEFDDFAKPFGIYHKTEVIHG